MDLRLLLSRLASAETRRAAGRGLAAATIAGAALTLIVFAASGRGLDRWLFIALAWVLFLYVPGRILLEAAQTLAPALRRRLGAASRGDTRRYATRPGIELAVDTLFEREVVMPRIATPRESAKAKTGAVALLLRAGADDGVLREAAGDCLAAVDRWVAHLGRWAERDAAENIQARWAAVRALAGMAAMTKVLIASYEERARRPFAGGDGPLPPAAFLDACLDYCDDLALEVDVRRWEERPLALPLPEDRAERIRAAWTAYVETGAPALEARAAFVESVIIPSSRRTPPSA